MRASLRGKRRGKTTVTKLINGCLAFTADGQLQGDVTVAGMPVRDTAVYELAKEVGSVFQNPKSQFFHLDTDSELEFGLENEGVPPEQIKSRVETTVRQLKIKKLMHRNIFSLSGRRKAAFGVRKRVCHESADLYLR